MNDVPRNDEPSDDIDDLYRRATALDPSRPSERVRDAVLSHAAQLAAERPAPTASSSSTARHSPWYKARRFSPRRLSTIVGTLAAAVLVGLLVVPRFLLIHDATLSSEPPAEISSIAAPAAGRQAASPKAEEIQPYISRPQERAAATARARALAAKEAQVDLNAASTPADERNYLAALPAAPAAASVPPTAVAQTPSLTLPAAPDSPVAGAALRRAAEQGDIPKLQTLFDLGVDVNARDADDRSALLLAVLNGRMKVVMLLLAHGADVNAADRAGTTPLQAAQSMHQTDIAAALRSAGAH